MLKRLKVKNVALIDETEVCFSDNLNILTGETGAGKSILIDSIHLALGAKADSQLIRNGQEYALVELEFEINNPDVIWALKEMEIFVEDDSTLVIQRRIMPKKSSIRINGETVTAKVLKEAAALLIDIHGQNEHQILLDEKKHQKLLDAYAGDDLQSLLDEFSLEYHQYKSIKAELEQAQELDSNREREISFAQFEVQEIKQANLQIGEDEEVETEFSKMEHIQQIGQQMGAAMQCIDSYDQNSVLSLLSTSLKCLNQASQFDAAISNQISLLEQAEEMIHDVSRSLNSYTDGLEFDTQRYQYLQNRLNLINQCKKKYGNTIEDILSYLQEREDHLNKFEDFNAYLESLSVSLDKSYTKLLSVCKKIDIIRKENAKKLGETLTRALYELNFEHVEFYAEVVFDETLLCAQGMNEIRFMISLNKGQPVKPLSMVASGGELSRIMLALKSIMAAKDATDTLIFDEIDAGISGITAWKVSEKLAVLGKHHQVICITHLAQIAAMADTHYLIEKSQTEDKTSTRLKELDEEGQLSELARLLGTDTMTESAWNHAMDLKQRANEVKA